MKKENRIPPSGSLCWWQWNCLGKLSLLPPCHWGAHQLRGCWAVPRGQEPRPGLCSPRHSSAQDYKHIPRGLLWGSHSPARRLRGLPSKGHRAASLSCSLDSMLLLTGKLRPGMGGDLPKVTWESGAEPKPLKLSQARVLMDPGPHYSKKHGAGRGRQAACTGTLLSGHRDGAHRHVPEDCLERPMCCTEARVSRWPAPA